MRQKKATIVLPDCLFSKLFLTVSTFLQFAIGIVVIVTSLFAANKISPWFGNKPKQYQYNCIVAYTFIYPFGFMLTLDSIQRISTLRHIPMEVRVIFLIFAGIGSIGSSSYYFQSSQWNGISYFELKHQEQNILYQSLLSLQLFLTYVPIGVTILCIAARLLYHRLKKPRYRLLSNSVPLGPSNSPYDDDRSGLLEINKNAMNFQPEFWNFNTIFTLAFIFILLPGLWLACTLLPNQWDAFFVDYIIEAQQQKSISAWTINVKFGNFSHTRYMYIYFDVLVFYASLIVTLSMGYLCHRSIQMQRVIMTPIIYFDKRNAFIPAFVLTVGQCFMLLLWSSVFISIFIFFYFYHEFGTYDPASWNKHIDQMARTLGILAILFLGLTLIPVSRGNPVVTYCFGITFEGAIAYHRILGSLFLLTGLTHVILMVCLFNSSVL